MRLIRVVSGGLALLILAVLVLGQTPNGDGANHFAKDGLSFDYPAGWQLNDQSTAQMQLIQLVRDGFAELRVRAPREWLKTTEKEAYAKKIMQDKYVEDFVDSLQQSGLQPKRSTVSTEIAGGPAEGTRIRAMLGGDPGGMDAYYRIVSDRFVQLSQIGSEHDFARSATAWDTIRNSIKVEGAPAPKPSPPPKKP